MRFSFLIILISILSFQSCTKPVDFDQIDDAEIKSTYVATQVYFDLQATDFLNDSGAEIPLQRDVIQAPIDDSSYKYLERIEFTIETQNSFDRAFNIQIILYDVNQTPIYVVQPTINVLANSGKTTTTIVIPEEDIPIIFSTVYYSFYLQLVPSTDGSVITINDPGVLSFKSYITLFLNYTTE